MRRCAACGEDVRAALHVQGDVVFDHIADPAIPESEVKALMELWLDQQREYPHDELGQGAGAAVRCCARELAALLEDKSNA